MDALRVQLLAEKAETSVPSQYIQTPQNRPQIQNPNPNIKAAIPLIDLGSRSSNLLDELKNACKKWGAFQVINHKVPIGLLDDMRRVGRTFFEERPMEEKLRVQLLAEKAKISVPSQYIQPAQNRPQIRNHNPKVKAEVPVIDLRSLSSNLLDELKKACKEWGVFQVINHKVPIGKLDDMRRVGRTSFEERPMEEKLRLTEESVQRRGAFQVINRKVPTDLLDDMRRVGRTFFEEHPMDEKLSSNFLDELKKACKEWGAFQVINHKVPIGLLDDMRRVGRTFFEERPMEEKLRSNLLDELKKACKEWGAFQVINHKVPIGLLDDMWRVGRTFFEELTMEEKLRYSCDSASPASEGYGSRMLVASNDTVLDWRDYFDHHTLPLSRRDPSHWPDSPADYRKIVAEYSDHMKALAQELLGFISESLGLTCQCIENVVGEFYQNITISYYPSCPQPELTLGLQSHSDMGAITLLIQDDVEGLEVFNNGEWVTVNPMSNAICVILADQTEIITNGEYRSAQHRAVTNAGRARLSVATFHDPAKTREISPAFHPPKYRPVIYGDYVSSWYTKGPEGKRNLDALLI